MRSQEADKVQAVRKLQQDLLNGPLHCFGSHSNCSPDFCKTIQKQQHNNSEVSTADNSEVSTAETTLVGNTERDTTTNDSINDITSGMRQY